ncbi:hypothetical protein HYT23_05770 [Candidatus Pacearchaeota archaeon]|nr:hypothetical protein [Candidatus Pacearchaeota archaeon]
MERTDFIGEYHLGEARRRAVKDLNVDGSNLGEMVNSAVSPRTCVTDLEVGKNDGLYIIRFSSDNYTENNYDSFVLAPFSNSRLLKIFPLIWPMKTILKTSRNPFISLAYSSYGGGDNPNVTIEYIQSTNRMKRDVYDSLQSKLGANPHEFLLAHFLSRISSVLDARPEVDVRVSSQYTLNSICPRLRDRFFDRRYNLNPKKERVRQILGKDNAWLKYRK